MSDSFIIPGPCLWSISGGRTSGDMLRRALQAYGGQLPDDHVVAFSNTGRERPETLWFVEEMARRWAVRIIWVEWRSTPEQAAKIATLAVDGRVSPEIVAWSLANAAEVGFAIVSPNSASRSGEPFEALIALKQRLPNWQERWCTTFLNVRPMHALMRRLHGVEPGWFREPVGLRADEPKRIASMVAGDADTGRRRLAPLAREGVVKADVMRAWAGSDFDLPLEPWEGNCDLCFAIGKKVRLARLRRNPDCGRWWARLEAVGGRQFDRRDSVKDLMAQAPTARHVARDLDVESECGDGGCDVVRASLADLAAT